MKNRSLLYLIALSVLYSFFFCLPVYSAGHQEWLNRLIPLPKEIRFDGEITVAVKDVSVCLRPGAGPVERNAAEELASLLGTNIRTSTGAGKFEIVIGMVDSRGTVMGINLAGETERLKTLPNSEQAYVIRRKESNRLVLAGIDERGVYYAVQTLEQLLGNRFDRGMVTIPLAEVTDWPDLKYRGMWDDTFPADQIEWMASLKMNLVDCLTNLTVDEDGHGRVTAIPSKGPTEIEGVDFPTFCARHAVHFVPIILHLSHLERTGIYKKYPDLIGRGATIDDRFIPPCANRPELAAVLADWMEALAGQPSVDEISIWLSEVEQQCDCEECRKAGQYVMETRAILKAYERARVKYPNLRIRILLTQGSYPTNEKILAEIPGDVGVVYYHGEKTYDSSREPMIYFPLREYAARGRMLGVCPQLTVSWAVVCPWSSPQFVRARMNEYVDKGLTLLSAYATPNLMLYEFNIAAAAEWSWNAHGRSERDFALAWVTRRGMKNPGAAADWAVLLGSVSWDIYGSAVPFNFVPGFGITRRMIENRVRPILGEDMFRYFPTTGDFDRALEKCDRALAIARTLDDPKILEETTVVRGYIVMAREIYEITERISGGVAPDDSVRKEIEMHLEKLTGACSGTNDALKRWEALFGEGAGGGRFTGTLKLSEDITAMIRESIR
ncbi:glycoside hydrolase family 20 zincin-like fold domain-containing protein [bacterium]|nr:glycoside hydrolase family 20 zincin-like fold domain-containing protein [bacterium]